MNILICGANGFVGRHLTQRLREAGYTVFRGVRRPTEPGDLTVDYRTDTMREIWMPRLAGIQVVINAVGVLRDSVDQPMLQLHAKTPEALFAACAEAGVERIVHVSALGVDGAIDTPYFQTRRIAEATLHALSDSIRWLILRPSLIYGEDGASARLFRLLARLPLHVLPMGGEQRLQPVHIDDISEAVTRWLAMPHASNQTISAAGSEATTLRGMLDSYRAQMQRSEAWHLAMPSFAMRLAARAGDVIPASPLCSDTLTMLSAGNTGDASCFAQLLGSVPGSYRDFITRGMRGETR
jgi:uncharacterized protein YbjT (DUF2867 family)